MMKDPGVVTARQDRNDIVGCLLLSGCFARTQLDSVRTNTTNAKIKQMNWRSEFKIVTKGPVRVANPAAIYLDATAGISEAFRKMMVPSK